MVDRKTKICMNIDDRVRDKLGVHSASSSDSKMRTVNTEWNIFVKEVGKLAKQNNIEQWTMKEIKKVFCELENESYNAMIDALTEFLYRYLKMDISSVQRRRKEATNFIKGRINNEL